ncbi:sulfatase-like hydrolase/transferase [Tamlana sp. 2201CG12-4]|uniref:sulfatase-like hydrolase/transferase n=1 Tax=Tamlana sp. 2201CG12-4 TaxID=3112582 RepID=UPI002DBC2368|nr:sulfatase-like hydrolase/transferase [Tamlana sp. 2201CG12-4]MEC3908412.1 sulfatase-like hydrolase/transferase [Tamlana sp. 2201CG12-4]
MKKILIALLFVCLFLGVQVAFAQKPNIIVIVADDLGNADVGYHNQSTDIPTPNIDLLAQGGTQFSAGYVTAPVCGPSRAGLLTGRYQQSFGFEDNPGPFRANPSVITGIPNEIPTFAESLKSLGYATGMVGKWHVGGDEHDDFYPTNKGFDEFFGFLGGAANYFPENNEENKLMKNNSPVAYEGEYLTDAFGREATDFIDRNQSQPFFLYLPFNAVHGPIQAPQATIDLFSSITDENRRKMVAMQYEMDENIGRVLQKLEDTGLTNNTLIFFVSDNGGKPGSNYSLNTPYFGEKGQLYEGGIRLPFCIKWPGHVPANVIYDKPVSTIDFLPTAIVAAGGTIDASNGFHGTNLIPFIDGTNNTDPHEFLYWKLGDKWAIRDANWKLVFNDDSSTPKLFNILSDKEEAIDLYLTNSAEATRLQDKFNEWSTTLPGVLWGWRTSIGSYVRHHEFTFDNIALPGFLPYKSNVTVAITDNPDKSGVNTSNKVLNITRLNTSAPDEAGVTNKVSQFQRKMRYMHMKVYKERLSPVKITIEKGGETPMTQSSISAQTKINEWEDLVFDFDTFSGAVNRITIHPDFEVGALHTMYVDDIIFSDDPTPRTVPFSNTSPTGLNAQSIEEIRFSLTWDKLDGATDYNVFQDDILIATANTEKLEVSGLTSNQTYTYTIQGISANGQLTNLSAPLNVTTNTSDPDMVLETFENETTLEFVKNGNGVEVEVVSNSNKAGENDSNKVLKITIPSSAQVYAGTSTEDFTPFNNNFKYLHYKVFKPNTSTTRGKFEDASNSASTKVVKESTVPYSNSGKWQDMVFDFSTYTGLLNKITFQVDYISSRSGTVEVFIDDIYLSNDPAPSTAALSVADNRSPQNIDFKVFPNPVEEILNISFKDHMPISIGIYDIQGRMTKQLESNNDYKISIPVSSLKSGMYLVKIKTTRFTTSKLFVKK